MSRYTGAACRICRREGMKLMLKGERCFTAKCAMEKRAYPPGQHGQRRKKLTQYAIQLREKQKLRCVYGVGEKQFRNYFSKAERQKGPAGENFLRILERRLDNVIYRLRLASSRNQARQMVSHGHIMVDGRKVDISSYLVQPGQEIEVREESRSVPWLKEGMEAGAEGSVPSWLKLEPEKFKGSIVGFPSRQDIDLSINEQLIVEFYSK